MANGALTATAVLLDLIEAAMQVGNLIKNAQDEGRDITDEELAALKQQRTDAWARFDSAGP